MDVRELRAFYDSPLGVTVRRLLRQRIRERWPRVTGEVVIGLGFASPYLASFRSEASVLGALMPATQGVVAWPLPGPASEAPAKILRQSVLVEESALPLPDASVDRLLLVHCLEMSEQVRVLLREVWRVLKPEGHLLVVTPNRRGPWARFEATPFGHGRPYSRGQLDGLLLANMFSPVGWSSALMMPPLDWRVARRYADTLERTGTRWWPAIAGVNLVEARKEMVAPIAVSRRLAGVRQLRPFRTAPAMPMAARGDADVIADAAQVATPKVTPPQLLCLPPPPPVSAGTPLACPPGS